MFDFLVELIQSICLIVASIIIVIATIGILRLDDEMDKIIYVRIHILGMVDIAAVLAMIGLGQFLLAGIYFILAPFVAHAMANAYYHGEDNRKYEVSDELTGRVDDNIHNNLAVNESTTIDAGFKSNFESDSGSNIKTNTEFDVESNVELNVESEDPNNRFTNSGIAIKEVSTDDIENSNLDKEDKSHKGGGEEGD